MMSDSAFRRHSARSSSVRRRPLVWLTALAAICVVAFALWALFGLRRAGWADAWTYYGSIAGGESLAPLLNSRPLNWLPWVVSYGLAPQSFLGMNLLIAWFILLKGVLVYAVVRQLAPGAAGLALATALLAMIYPAEVGYFNDGYLNLHQGFDAYLLAVFFLLAYWKRRRGWLLAAAVAALAFSVATYEAVLALAAATPLLLVWLERRISRRVIWASVLWWSPVALYLLYVALLRISSVGLNPREAGLLASGLGVPNLPLEVINANLWNLAQRYAEGWRDALTLSPFNGSSALFRAAAITGAVVAPIFFVHLRASRLQPAQEPRWPLRRWLELFALSILWTVLGYAVFSLASVRYDGWRLGFYTVLGSSLTIALILYSATSHRRVSWLLSGGCAVLALALSVSGAAPVGWIVLAITAAVGFALPRPANWAVVLGVVLTIAMVRQLDLLRWLTGEALAVQQLISEAVLAAPGLEPDTPLVLVIEGAPSAEALPFDTSTQFQLALDLIHGNRDFAGIVCPLGLPEWGWERETCVFTENGLFVQRGAESQTIPYDALVLVALEAEGTVRLIEEIPERWGGAWNSAYDPWRLLDRAAPPPALLETLLNPRPLADR